MHKKQLFILAIFLLVLPLTQPTFANQPVVENHQTQATRSSSPYELFGSAMILGDPTFSSYTIFGSLNADSIDMYYFVPQQEDTIPVELLVPAKTAFANFLPKLVIIGKYIAGGAKNPSDIPVPIGFESITADTPTSRTTLYDALSLQTLYHGAPQLIHVIPGEAYFLAILDPTNFGGSYAIRLGTKNNFSGSVKDTTTAVNTNTLVFENYPALPNIGTPTSAERKLFPEQKTPFETLDSRIRLWTDILFFYLNRIPAAIFNK